MLAVPNKTSIQPRICALLLPLPAGTVSLSSFKGKKPIVLFFYPKASTPGCTKEVRFS